MTTTEPSTDFFDLDGYIDAVVDEGEAFAALARTADLDAAIAACPGWAARDLVTHVGLVHLWAAANIVHPSNDWITVKGFDDLRSYWPELTETEPNDAGIVDWYRATLANLVDVLRTTPADHQCLTFLPAPSPLVMWARRQASEIAVHRYDLASAGGRVVTFDAVFAADMLDELLVGFASRIRVRDITEETIIEVVADDIDVRYFLEIGPAGLRSSSAASSSDLTVRGSVADLYLYFWNRPAGPTIRHDGNLDAMQVWRQVCDIKWR